MAEDDTQVCAQFCVCSASSPESGPAEGGTQRYSLDNFCWKWTLFKCLIFSLGIAAPCQTAVLFGSCFLKLNKL